MILACLAGDFDVSGSSFRRAVQEDKHSQQVILASLAVGSGKSSRRSWCAWQVHPVSLARGSGTSERWFRHAQQLMPECPASGSGVAAGDFGVSGR